MADRPILFSAPMINAMLAGRKTQTRRLLNPQPETFIVDGKECDVIALHVDGEVVPRVATGRVLTGQKLRLAIGDRLYVREEWRVGKKWDATKPSLLPARTMTVLYGAGGESCVHLADGVWRECLDPPESMPDWAGRRRPGMHMPRWASRLTLIVEDVRVERLQAITNEDCIAEGIPVHANANAPRIGPVQDDFARQHGLISHYGAEYRDLWNSLHDKPGERWADNPFVVAVTFRVARGNIDQVPA